MQRVTMNNISKGMVTARNVYDAAGQVLVKANMVLIDQYVNRLRRMNIGSIYVVNPLLENVELPEMVKEETRVNAVKAVQAAYQAYPKGEAVDSRNVENIADKIVEEVLANRQQMLQGTDMRTYTDYLYAHAVNVAVLSVMIGVNMDYNNSRLKDLAWGALMHDLGEMKVPPEISGKQGKLSPEEWSEVKKHPELGFELLRKGSLNIPLPVAHIAFQHHENFDGSGYPRNLKGEEIHEYARIVAIANVYDALVADRPFRPGFASHMACELMMTMAGRFLDTDILKVFLERVASYPIGSVVRLSNKETGVVTAVPEGMASRPQVKIILDDKGRVCAAEECERDLSKELTLFVDRVLDEEAVIKIGNLYAKSKNAGHEG
ncbi:HD-GYP domain-containing protein [Azotosporobacter soli]|uniref:HD-GYP domain-containing protein n=1 Tax=Azotosporobacter soli TaxID=3055040 RepID=UPI0031FF1E28